MSEILPPKRPVMQDARWRRVAFGAAIVLSLTVLAWAVVLSGRDDVPASESRLDSPDSNASWTDYSSQEMVQRRGGAHTPKFSPDGSKVAFGWESYEMTGLGPEGRRTHCALSVRWCDVEHPESPEVMEVDAVGEYKATSYMDAMSPPCIEFSPDSRHLAVVSRGVLSCLDLASGKLWRLTPEDELVTSFAWVSPSEVVYVVESFSRPFVRKRIHDPVDERQILHENKSHAVGYGGPNAPSERWSPGGRYAFFLAKEGDYHELRLFNLAAGAVEVLGRGMGKELNVAWKPDGSKALCVICERSYGDSGPVRKPVLALLVDPSSADTVDFLPRFLELSQNADRSQGGKLLPSLGWNWLRIDRNWTAEGAYLFVDCPRGGCLVRPDPWEVIPIAEQLFEALGPGGDPALYPNDKDLHPGVSILPIPGWIGVVAGNRPYAVNYECNRSLLLMDEHMYTGDFAISPDGKRVFWPDPLGRTVIRAVDLNDARDLE